jgi:hypothetical protein
METKEHTKLADNDSEENVAPVYKPFLFGLIGLAIIMSIFVLLPMLFTYFSEGDARAPSQIHPADPLGKSDHTIYKSEKAKK